MTGKIRANVVIMLAVVFLLLALSSCGKSLNKSIKENKSVKDIAVEKCVEKCRDAVKNNVDLSNGPCLSNNIADGYVCDVAHNPREDIDNLKENQCNEFGKTRHHFVEVDENCNIIRVY